MTHTVSPDPLYPFQYARDGQAIRRDIEKIERALIIERHCLHAAMKEHAANPEGGLHRVVRGHRQQIDRLTRYARNGETRLRELVKQHIRLVVDNARRAA